MRRVVIGENKEGKSSVLADGEPAKVYSLPLDPKKRDVISEIWATDGIPALPGLGRDPTVDMTSYMPPVGATRCRVLKYPPDKELVELARKAADSGINLLKEFYGQMPGIDNLDRVTGLHATDSVDYGVIISGQIDVEVDDGREVHLSAGDSYVMIGSKHAWHNRYEEPCTFVVFMVGGRREG